VSRRQSGLATLLVALPWWVSVTLAAIAYVALAYGAPSLNLSNPFLQSFALAPPPRWRGPSRCFCWGWRSCRSRASWVEVDK